jgi:hypothetical protein
MDHRPLRGSCLPPSASSDKLRLENPRGKACSSHTLPCPHRCRPSFTAVCHMTLEPCGNDGLPSLQRVAWRSLHSFDDYDDRVIRGSVGASGFDHLVLPRRKRRTRQRNQIVKAWPEQLHRRACKSVTSSLSFDTKKTNRITERSGYEYLKSFFWGGYLSRHPPFEHH